MSKDEYVILRELDRRHGWHPFTQMQTWMREDPLIIASGDGNYLIDVNGTRYLDGVSSLWCNVHGHRKHELDLAISAQANKIAHSTMLGLANVPATKLAAELVELVPAGLSRVFYSDSGAEAVEVAVRMVTQYWQLQGQSRRARFLTLTQAYHGDTIGSVSLGYSEHFHWHLKPLLFPVLKVDPPHFFYFYKRMSHEEALGAALAVARETIEMNADELAALVIEPMMQGAAGMWNHCAEYLRAVTAMARRAGALIIADEVATGFGRTGKMFACEHADLSPDILCLGKGITGGYTALAATLTTEEIFNAFLGEPDSFRAFYYGHTYTGNPLATAVARANLRIFREEAVLVKIQLRIRELETTLRERFGRMAHIADIRHHGLMVGIELMRDPEERVAYDFSEQVGARVTKSARRRRVIIRPLGDVIILMPPLSISQSELDTLLGVTHESIKEITENDN